MAQLAPVLGGLILVSPSLALVGTFLLAPFAVGIAALRRRWRRSSERSQELAEDLHTGVDELVENLDLWRSYGAAERVELAIDRAADEAVRASARVDAARAALSGANEVLGALALVGVLALARQSGISLGEGTLVAFATMCFMAYRPLRDLGDSRAWITRGTVALDAVETLAMETTEDGAREVSAAEPRLDAGELELRNLGARERGPCTSFVLAPGEAIALVGPTGSGKTTLFRVLLGLEPARGFARFGGRDLTRAGVGPSARPFAWVPQDAPLVTGTVLENVALLSGDESRARLALVELGAERLLGRAGEKVGPGGRPLSGGERRLVAIARALATGLPLLLLDEPTAGLDADSRARVLAALGRLRGRRAMIIATHHDEVVRLADRVVELGHDAPADVIAAE